MQQPKIARPILAAIFAVGMALPMSQAHAAPLKQQKLNQFTNVDRTSCGPFCGDWSLTYSGGDTLYDAYWYTAKVGTSPQGDQYVWNDAKGAWEFGGTSGKPTGDYSIGLDYSLIDTSEFGDTNGAGPNSQLPAISLGDLAPGDTFTFQSAYNVAGAENGFFATSYVVGADSEGQIADVPVPASLPLLALGLFALGVAIRRSSSVAYR